MAVGGSAWAAYGAVNDGDEVEHACECAEEHADVVDFSDGGSGVDGSGADEAGVPLGGEGVSECALVLDFELVLVDVVCGECDGACECLGVEPESVFAAIDGVDAADEDS